MGLVPALAGESRGSVSYAHSVGLAATSKRPAIAFDALQFYAGKDDKGELSVPRARLLGEGGRSPFPALYADPAVKDLIQRMTVGNASEFLRLSDIARQREGIKTAWYSEWEMFMMTQVQDAMLGSTSVKDAIRKSADEARRLRTA